MTSPVETPPPTNGSAASNILDDLTSKLTRLLTQTQPQTHTQIPINESSPAQIGIKLNDTNYALWSQVVEMFISGKDKLGYINGDITQPELTDSSYRRWRTENSIVKGWIINSMEPELLGNFI
jgi:hypothetical protein